jgi:cell division protein FtsI (penicillin-binding protein 3)
LRNIRIITVLLLVLILAFLLLAGRCFYLQFLKSGYYKSACLRQQQRLEPQKPQRGVILDCRGRILAASNKVQTVFAEPRAVKNPQETSAAIAQILNMSAGEVRRLIEESNNPGFVKIKTDVEPDLCSDAAKIRGIGVQSDWQRHYPAGRLAAHIVGFTGLDDNGLGGIELQYNKELTGTAAKDIFFADAAPYRRPIRLKEQTGTLRDGCGIILTIDSAIQQFARSELLKQYKDYEAEAAIAIVAEPKTGAILAMVSLPDFEPNNIRSADPNDFRNHGISDQFEPGSLFKPVTAAVALDAGAVGLNDTIFCEYGNYHGKGFGQIGEYEGHRYGNLSIREILALSSNIGMAKIGQKLGKDNLYSGLKLFGFGQKTGIDLPGEAEGLLHPVENWTGYSITRIPYGQEISVTAIQILRVFCILSNGGFSVRPYLVKAVIDNNGNITKLKQPGPTGVGYVIKPQTAQWITRTALVAVVNEGTGKKAKLEKWQVFGKTGTANVARSDGKGYEEDAYIASFGGGAPADNPKVVVLVSIRKPNPHLGKGYSGGTVAAPVAAKIIEKTLNYLEGHQQ